MIRVSFYIDGFNLYHKIDEYYRKTNICYKWLNYKSLLFSLLHPSEVLQDIYFFTATPTCKGIQSEEKRHIKEKSIERHNKYITALNNICIKVVSGNFLNKSLTCKVRGCNFSGEKIFFKPEEKKTDVNLAINMVLDARNNRFDKGYLVSSDSDFVPALEMVKSLGKLPGLIIPPQIPLKLSYGTVIKATNTNELERVCLKKNIIELEFKKLLDHILPKEVIDPKTNIVTIMPNEYMTQEQIKNKMSLIDV